MIYANDIVYRIGSACDEAGIEHPTIISESGRAVVSYHSVLVFDVFGVNAYDQHEPPEGLPENSPQPLKDLFALKRGLTDINLLESYHDSLQAMDDVINLFRLGHLSIEQRALAESIYWSGLHRMLHISSQMKNVPEDLLALPTMLSDIYFCNLSVFQSIPDIRWHETEGKPYCPRCGCAALYTYTTRALWKCKACNYQFSVTSGTIFASRKLAIRDILLAIALFCNAVKGISALQLSRDLGCHYRTAFVLSHKLREAMGAELAGRTLQGEVEVDGMYCGGNTKPENRKVDRKDRRLSANQTGKRQVVVVMRERNGKTLPFVFHSEADSIGTIQSRVAAGSTVYADEAPAWDALHAKYMTRRINHSQRYADGQVSTNWAESYFSRLRRAEIGVHHHISGPYLGLYAAEMGWREDNRRKSNGEQHLIVAAAALSHGVSRQWKGYNQRWVAA